MYKIDDLRLVIELAGGQTALAEKLTELASDSQLIPIEKSVSQQSVSHWINRHKQSPSKFVGLIAAAVNHKVTAKQLRPDLYPSRQLLNNSR